MNENVCRLCRRESDNLESLTTVLEDRNGLPISVITMIICPIKIERSDLLPKLICGDCLEIVLGAYKLRDESLESDRYFRDCIENGLMGEQDESSNRFIKQEDSAEHYDSIVYSVQEEIKPQATTKNLSPRETRTDFREDEEFPYQVECFKKGVKKSSAWDYFGRLVDRDGEIIESEDGYFFCAICVDDKKSIKRRYKSEKISTGMIFQHMKATHGIGKEMAGSDEEDEKLSTSKKEEKPVVQGLTFTCPEEGCRKVYKLKMCLDIHLGLEHTGIADEEMPHSNFNVRTSHSRVLKSMAWKYFGALLDGDFEMVDESHNYCRLCVGAGNVTGKYVKSCSTTTLLHHLRDQHLTVKRKRKRFGSLELSSITPERRTKN